MGAVKMDIKNMVCSENIKVYSFDIFDTLITRRTMTPLGIFAIMQDKLKKDEIFSSFSNFFKENFAFLRHESENWERENVFRNRTGAQDITFDEIYSLIQKNQNLTDEQVNLLKELEIQTEKDNLVPIAENINILKKLKEDGKEIVLISDMYFSSAVLKDFMVNIDPVFCDIDVFTSADILKSKYFGELYKFVKNKKGYDFNKWVHVDDNHHNVNMASELGITGVDYTPYGKSVFDIRNSDNEYKNVYQIYFGSSRLCMINHSDKENKLFEFGCTIMGPVLFSFASWVVKKALEDNIKHLYFIARDGFIPFEIAKRIVQKFNLDIKLHYIYGSRKTWRIPEYNDIIDHINIIFGEFPKNISLKYLAYRFNMEESELEPFIDKKFRKGNLSYGEAKKLKIILSDNAEFVHFLMEKNSIQKELVIKYLKQEIDFSKNDFAFVDINGSGRTQDYLQKIVKSFCPYDIKTYFMFLNTDSSRKNCSIKISFIPTLSHRTYYVEIFTTSLEGSTIGYAEKDGIIKPILEENNAIKTFDYQKCIDGTLEFSDIILESLSKNPVNEIDISLFEKYFNFLAFYFNKETADILGKFPFTVLNSKSTEGESAPPYSWFDVFKFVLNGKEKVDYINNISIVRSSKLKQKIIKKVYKHGCIKNKISSFTKNIFSIANEYSSAGREKVFTLLGIKFRFSMTKPSFYTDIYYCYTLLKFLVKKRKREKITKIEKIRFITYREPLYKGGGGGQGAAMTMNKLILPEKFNNIPIEYTFEIPNKYLRDKNYGPNVEFSGIKFAIDETKNDKNIIYVTHEEATAFGLWLMGKNYIMFSHLQGARAEESKNFGYKFSKVSENIIKFCEATAMKNAYWVSFVSNGAYHYFCNSQFRGLDAKDFKKGPIVYNTLYVENEPEQYKDLKYNPEYLTILTSGSLTTAKGVDRTLELVEKICSKTDRKIRQIFIGEGVMQNFVETRLAEISKKYPHFSYITVSRCSDGNMPYLQSLCDVFIVLHRIAIFDLSTLEMMNKAKAVVLSDVGGNPEFNVENNIIMWSEEKQNYDEVADKVLNSDLKALGQKNKEVYDNYFGHKPYITAYNDLLENFSKKVLSGDN